MLSSLKRFGHYFSESTRDFETNFKLYFLYIVFFVLISIVQAITDSYIPSNQWWARALSKFLFSGIPILVLSKILYIAKARVDVSAEYSSVLIQNILYSSYYFCAVMVSALIYPFAVGILLEMNIADMKTSFILCLPLLAPFFYVIMFYSLSPFVAVFEERGFFATFNRSRELTRKDILLVFAGHFCSLIIPALSGLLVYMAGNQWRVGVGIVLSVPEAILTIVFLLTTIKIYLYLSEVD